MTCIVCGHPIMPWNMLPKSITGYQSRICKDCDAVRRSMDVMTHDKLPGRNPDVDRSYEEEQERVYAGMVSAGIRLFEPDDAPDCIPIGTGFADYDEDVSDKAA